MNILYITPLNPVLATYGGEQRGHLLWEALKQCGTVYTLVAIGGNVPAEYDADNRIRTVSADSPSKLFKALDRLLIRIGFGIRWPWHSRRNVRRLIGWSEVKFDAVVCYNMMPAAMLSAWKIAPCYVDINDYPPAKFESMGSGWLPKILVNAWTRYILRKCRGAWIPDASQVAEISRFTRCAHLPNLARLPSANYRVDAPQKMQLMTVGLMYYTPNYEGVDWFVKNIWTAVKAKYPELTYKIAGKGAPEHLAAAWRQVPGVSVLGFVEDLEALYAESLAVVAPVLKGAGTCIKIMEAAVYGRTCFAVPFAVRGYEKHFAQVFEDAGQFLQCFAQVLEQQKTNMLAERQLKISNEARELNGNNQFCGAVAKMIRSAK